MNCSPSGIHFFHMEDRDIVILSILEDYRRLHLKFPRFIGKMYWVYKS